MKASGSDALCLPTFLGIGGRRCATTWISECLRYHPDIFMTSPKELHFFSLDTNWHNGPEWYSEHFAGSRGHKVVGEYSTSYLLNPDCVPRIIQVCPAVKIVVSLRNPADRFLSDYKMSIRMGKFPRDQFRVLNLESYHQAVEKNSSLRDDGHYEQGLRRYFDAFGRENVHVLLKEHIDQNPRQVLMELYRFLGVDPNFVPPILMKKVSPGIVPKYSSLENLRVRLVALCKRRAPRIINLVRKYRLAEVYRRLNAARVGIEVSEDVRTELVRYYRDSVAGLEDLLGYKLDEWDVS